MALVWQIERTLECRECHTRRDEYDSKLGGRLDAYYVDTWICEGCKKIEAKQNALAKQVKEQGASSIEGVKLRLVPREEHLANLARNREANIARQKMEAEERRLKQAERQEARKQRLRAMGVAEGVLEPDQILLAALEELNEDIPPPLP